MGQGNAIKSFFSRHFEFSKTEWLVFFSAILLGVVLRGMLFFSTDITWDEAFHIMLAFKLGVLFLKFPLIFLGLILATAVFVYFALIRQNLIATAVFSLLLPVIVFVFGLPITIHPTHPPFFNILEGSLIAITGLGPELLGKLISSTSSFLLAFSGFFLARHLSGKKAGLIVFLLLVLSPYSVFYSTTTYITMLADSLAFLALTLFVIGLDKNNKLVPWAGFFFALAFFTRYTTLMFLLPVLLLLFLNHKKVLEKENFTKYAIFSIIILSILVSLFPAIASSFNNFSNWTGANTADLYIRDIPHYSSFLANQFGVYPISSNLFFFVTEMLAFYSLALPLLFVIAVVFIAKQKRKIPLIFALLFFAYFAFYSMSTSFQDMNYLLEMEFPMLLISGIFLGELKIRFFGKAILAALLVLFLLQGIFFVLAHDFKGLSETVAKIPSDKTIMTDFIDPVRYYTGEYVFDTKINNKAFLFLEGAARKDVDSVPQGRILPYRQYLEKPGITADYAVLTEFYFVRGFSLEEDFKKCFDIKSEEFTAFTVFAKSSQLCSEIS